MATGGVGPVGALTLGARPVARSLLLSPAYQRAALAQSQGPGLLSQLPAGLLDQNLTRNGMPGLMGLLAPRAMAGDL